MKKKKYKKSTTTKNLRAYFNQQIRLKSASQEYYLTLDSCLRNRNIGYLKDEFYLNRDLSWFDFEDLLLYEGVQHKDAASTLKFMQIVDSNLFEFLMVRMGRHQNNFDATEPLHYGLFSKDIIWLASIRTAMLYKTLNTMETILLPSYNNYENDTVVSTTFNTEFKGPLMSQDRLICIDDFDGEKNKLGSILASKEPYFFIQVHATVEQDGGYDDTLLHEYIYKIPTTNRVKVVKGMNGEMRIELLDIALEREIDEFLIKRENQKLTKRGEYVSYITFTEFAVTHNCDVSIPESDDQLKSTLDMVNRRQTDSKISALITFEAHNNLRLNGDSEYHLDEDITSLIYDDLYKKLGIYGMDKENHVTRSHISDFKFGVNKSYYADIIKELPAPKPVKNPAEVGKNIIKKGKSVISAINKKKEIVLYHPYDNFDIIVRFIKEAAKNKHVTLIRQTLYRVSKNSPIVDALCKAAKNGKEVVVYVELKARFDEAHNVEVTRKLLNAGCIVKHSTNEIKTHAKITQVLMDNGKSYLHLGSGNYNDVTSQIYTDISVLTSMYKSEANLFFESIDSAVGKIQSPKELKKRKLKYKSKWIKSPLDTKDAILKKIKACEKIKIRRKGNPRIVIRVNALGDPDIAKALYECANNYYVPVTLLVRGVNCLAARSGNIIYDDREEKLKVYSRVGHFLEHARVYYFDYGNGKEEMFVGSADLLGRNLYRRNEILFSIQRKKNIQKILSMVIDNIDPEQHTYERATVPYYGRPKNMEMYKIVELPIKFGTSIIPEVDPNPKRY